MLVFLIISVVLNITSQTKHLTDLFTKHRIFAYKASVSAVEEKTARNVYEELRDFNIKNDKIIKKLKNERQFFKKDILFNDFVNIEGKNINVKLIKIKIYDKQHSVTLYKPVIQ